MATKIELRSMAELRVMSPEERLKYGKALVTVKDAAKDATEAHKDSFKAAGKYLCILEEKLVEAKLARLEPANTDLKTYFKRFIGVDGNISGHAYTLKDAYGVYVTSGLLTEEHFDKASANALESAHKVYVAVVEKGSGLTDASVQKAAALLRDRADGYAKVLTELAKSLKAPKRIAEGDIVAFLTSAFAEDTGHLVIVARELGASIAAVRKTSAEWLRQGVFCHLAVAAQSCGTPDEIAKWMKGGPGVPTQPTPTEKPTNANATEVAASPSPSPTEEASKPTVETTGNPAADPDLETARTLYPGLSDEDYQALAAAVNGFRTDTGKAPETAEELDAYLNVENPVPA